MNRTAVFGGILVVLIGISVYMWSSRETLETDNAIAQTSESYSCTKCGNEFQLTVQEASDQLAAQGGVVCPACNETTGQKRDVKVRMGSFADSAEEEPQEPNAPTEATGAMKRQN